jgi:hypothetical protein
MIKRLWPSLVFFFTGRYTFPVDKQKNLEDFLYEYERIPLDEKHGINAFQAFSNLYSTMYPLLSKSFHKRFSDECSTHAGLSEKHLDNLCKGKW